MTLTAQERELLIRRVRQSTDQALGSMNLDRAAGDRLHAAVLDKTGAATLMHALGAAVERGIITREEIALCQM